MLLDFLDMSCTEGAMYTEIYRQIAAAAAADEITEGERLPSIREAAAQLKVSRTTIENAYMRLCIEGIAESRPQRGYYICKKSERSYKKYETEKETQKIHYDFSSQKIDVNSADTALWRKTVRAALNDSEQLISYGDPQGEPRLRRALAAYAFKARGVVCNERNIVIGAGTGPLLHIICGLLKGISSVGIENGGFKQAECIFGDYGIPCKALDSDVNGVKISALEAADSDVLFLMPSQLSKISVSGLSRRRAALSEWAGKKNGRIIIEDDYNGELRYSARGVPAFQGKESERVIYIGSFSKLLLPSVRIAYMVLPDYLADIFESRKNYYNQTCGKTEQLALTSYIESGALERHLRKLRKLYNRKSRILCDELKENIRAFSSLELFETSLTVLLKTVYKASSDELCKTALKSGIRLIPSDNCGEVRLCFGGIMPEDIHSAVTALDRCWSTDFGNTIFRQKFILRS